MVFPRRRDPKKREDPRSRVDPSQREEPKGARGPKRREDPRSREEPRGASGPRKQQDTVVNENQQRLMMMLAELSSIRMMLSETENKVYRIDEVISKLPSRISSLRQMNYMLQTNLEEDQLKAADAWAMMGPQIKAEVSSRATQLKSEFSSIEREAYAYRSSPYGSSNLSSLASRLGAQRSQINVLNSRVQSGLANINSILEPVERGIAAAESTVNLTSSASFKWMEGETPVFSTTVKDMSEDVEGILTLTNQRLIFEKETEIVVNKFLFIVTEKKSERTTALQKFIGEVKSVSKGKVGFFEGEGLYIDFKNGGTNLKLDTTSSGADEFIKFYNLITTGQIDEDLKKTTINEEKPSAEKRLISCPHCGAPYTDEIYRGQQSVQCKYCGTRITL